jgi:DNA polymerase sigma
VQAYAPLRPLVLVLKYFLTRKGLCEAFTGGLSSYALLLVTARFLQEVRTHVRCVCVCVSF